jgi:RNA polymerase sigma factor (sigma-70 family)
MPQPSADATPLPRPVAGRFVTTHWSIVLAAGDASASDAGQALQTLSEYYWYPLYAFARRRGASAEDAADLTQEFFARLIEGEFLSTADPQKGRFRTFLLTIFQRFLASEYQKGQAARRGGGRRVFSIDAADGERRYAMEPMDVATPEMLYERRWAMTLLQRVLQRLEEEYRCKGKAELFEHCRERLAGTGTDGSSYAETAARLRMSEVAVRVAVHRMRERYRQLVREEVAGTVDAYRDVEEELQALRMAILGGTS